MLTALISQFTKHLTMKLFYSANIFFLVLVITKGCPTIISRAEWGARSPRGELVPLAQSPVPYVIIHHADTPSCTTKEDCSRRVRSIQNYHQDSKGWQDIGYNFLVGEDGNVYEGRGWTKQGAHTKSYNSKSIGICFLGTFSSKLPNTAALNVTKELIECGIEMNKIRSGNGYKLLGHRQASATDCPGQSLYDEIKTWPRYEPNP